MFYGLFLVLKFCLMGGIMVDIVLNFLKLLNVVCVGGLWFMLKVVFVV